MLARGSVQVFPESGHYQVPETVELMNRWPDCSIFLAPTMVKRLIEHGSVSALQPDALRLITYGGAPMYVADVRAAVARMGITRIVIAHRPETVAAAERVVALEGGRIVFDGPPVAWLRMMRAEKN